MITAFLLGLTVALAAGLAIDVSNDDDPFTPPTTEST